VITYRLRYQATDLELRAGDFVVGRSSSCNLALDDALVSRTHSVFRVSAEQVVVEDLGSRNGVLVNGERIERPTPLRHLDRVTIGSQEMVLIEAGRRRRVAAATGEAAPCRKCGRLMEGDETYCTACGTPIATSASTLAGATMELQAPAIGVEPDEVTRQATGLSLLAGIADKALALGRYEEAERILQKQLDAMLHRAKAGKLPSPETVRLATRYALVLAVGRKRASWIDWVFGIHAATRLLVEPSMVDELHNAVRDVGYRNPKLLREYLQGFDRDRLSPAERFVVRRLEGLERVVSA